MRGPRHPRHCTDEFKRQIVDLYNADKPKREIMDEYDLGRSIVCLCQRLTGHLCSRFGAKRSNTGTVMICPAAIMACIDDAGRPCLIQDSSLLRVRPNSHYVVYGLCYSICERRSPLWMASPFTVK